MATLVAVLGIRVQTVNGRRQVQLVRPKPPDADWQYRCLARPIAWGSQNASHWWTPTP